MTASKLIRIVIHPLVAFLGFGLLANLGGITSCLAQTKVFRAGAATSNITPPLGEGIVGNFGTPPPATQIHDPLNARCLVLDDGETKLVFVVCDNNSINREVYDEARRQIHEATRIPVENIMMSATHTHSATSATGSGAKFRRWHPDELDKYQRFLARRIADGVRVALNNLEPARIGWGVGSLPKHLFNRRWKIKPGTPTTNPFGQSDIAVMNPGVGNPNLLEPAGPTDPGVSFISVQSVQGKPIALLANYSLHYVGGLPRDVISADYFGMFADRIQELLKADRQNPGFVGILSNGTSGDVNNVDVKGKPEKPGNYEKMRLVANDLAAEVLRVHKTTKYRDWVRLASAQSELILGIRRPDAQTMQWANRVVNQPDSVPLKHRLERIYAGRTLEISEWPDSVSVILQAFKIGDLAVAAIPFETFSETGLEIKARSPFRPTFTIELANGYYGYLPTPEQHELGGYETWFGTNRVEVEASRKIVTELLTLFSKLE